MNKRDFMKSTAALASVPLFGGMMFSSATASSNVLNDTRKALGPTPSYSFDSASRVMTFYRADPNTQAMHRYLAAA